MSKNNVMSMSKVFEFSSDFSTQDLHLCETLEAEPHDAEWGEGAELKRAKRLSIAFCKL